MRQFMQLGRTVGVGVFLFLSSGLVAATDGPGQYGERADIQAYVAELATQHEFDAQALQALFASAQYRDDIVQRMRRPAEKVWTWARYQRHLVDAPRIEGGVAFWREHAPTLERAAEQFGVAPEIIVAVIGIETRYGQVRGSFPVLEALLTLGFDYPPRARFFRKELTEFLLLTRDEGKDPRDIVGSYAGAMGYGQFIPSSYRHYAVDFDADGVRDIWNNPVDAIGSVANYFARHRWTGEHPRALPVSVPAQQSELGTSTELKLQHTVAHYRGLGVAGAGLEALPPALPARVYRLQGAQGEEFWLALPDFYAITRYNHSHLYALAVHQLAAAIAAQHAAET